MNTKRCNWPGNNDLAIKYHDNEWGKPLHDDRKLFEFLILDIFQAGLSWNTILMKRENFREALDSFDYKAIASYDEKKVEELMKNVGIIRNRLKINATINNAQRFMEVQGEFGSFASYLWGFVNNKPIDNKFQNDSEIPAKTKLSNKITEDLKKRGFKFVGSTVVYAFIQSAGLVNDHLLDCSYR